MMSESTSCSVFMTLFITQAHCEIGTIPEKVCLHFAPFAERSSYFCRFLNKQLRRLSASLFAHR